MGIWPWVTCSCCRDKQSVVGSQVRGNEHLHYTKYCRNLKYSSGRSQGWWRWRREGSHLQSFAHNSNLVILNRIPKSTRWLQQWCFLFNVDCSQVSVPLPCCSKLGEETCSKSIFFFSSPFFWHCVRANCAGRNVMGSKMVFVWW